MREIHHRMPAILKPEIYEFWLNPNNRDATALKNILETALLTDLVCYPVSKQVNSARNNDPSCIETLSE